MSHELSSSAAAPPLATITASDLCSWLIARPCGVSLTWLGSVYRTWAGEGGKEELESWFPWCDPRCLQNMFVRMLAHVVQALSTPADNGDYLLLPLSLSLSLLNGLLDFAQILCHSLSCSDVKGGCWFGPYSSTKPSKKAWGEHTCGLRHSEAELAKVNPSVACISKSLVHNNRAWCLAGKETTHEKRSSIMILVGRKRLKKGLMSLSILHMTIGAQTASLDDICMCTCLSFWTCVCIYLTTHISLEVDGNHRCKS